MSYCLVFRPKSLPDQECCDPHSCDGPVHPDKWRRFPDKWRRLKGSIPTDAGVPTWTERVGSGMLKAWSGPPPPPPLQSAEPCAPPMSGRARSGRGKARAVPKQRSWAAARVEDASSPGDRMISSRAGSMRGSAICWTIFAANRSRRSTTPLAIFATNRAPANRSRRSITAIAKSPFEKVRPPQNLGPITACAALSVVSRDPFQTGCKKTPTTATLTQPPTSGPTPVMNSGTKTTPAMASSSKVAARPM